MEKSSQFRRIQDCYEELWNSADAAELDFGGKSFLDDLYVRILETDEYRGRLSSGQIVRVLDLGAGRGSRLARIVAHFDARLVALDCIPSWSKLELAYPGDRILADAMVLPFRNETMDMVISAYLTLNNFQFSTAGDRGRYLQEILRVLRPGGLFWGEEPALQRSDLEDLESLVDYNHLPAYSIHSFQKK